MSIILNFPYNIYIKSSIFWIAGIKAWTLVKKMKFGYTHQNNLPNKNRVTKKSVCENTKTHPSAEFPPLQKQKLV